MRNIVEEINHALDMGKNRLKWYTLTKDPQHMIECKEWNNIANRLIQELINS